jgi:hypothetical protein
MIHMNEMTEVTEATSKPHPAAPEPTLAKIRITQHGVKARGFTFAKGAVVHDVPYVHADFLFREGKAEILELK